MMVSFICIGLLGAAMVCAETALSLTSGGAKVDFFPRWAFEDTDCLGTTCPAQRVINLFIDEPYTAGVPLCDWAQQKVTQPSSAHRVWSNVNNENIELRVDEFVAALYGEQCLEAVSAAGEELVRVNGAAPTQRVQINVVESHDAATLVTPADFADNFLCWQLPATCAADESIVVNIIVSDWCDSGCFQSRDAAPVCYGDAGCAENGFCVDSNECRCADGYAGERCATRVGCDTDGCFNRGTCDAESGVCTCDAGFEGSRCQTPVANNNNNNNNNNNSTNTNNTPPAHGDELDIDQTWLSPFNVFPRGNFSHYGMLSFGQLPWRENWQQNAGSPIALPRDTADQVEGQGFVVTQVDYESNQLYYEVSFTLPRRTVRTGNQPATAPVAELFAARIGYTGDSIGVLEGLWCAVPSWVDVEWEAWKINGTLSYDAQYTDAIAKSATYVQITTKDRPQGALRAQVVRFDSALVATLAGSTVNGTGAGVFFVDTQTYTAQYWLHYTTPLDFVERGATLNNQAGAPVHPFPRGTIALRRVGKHSEGQSRIVCVLNKRGVFRFGADTFGDSDDVLAAMRQGAFSINIASNDDRTGALLGPIGV